MKRATTALACAAMLCAPPAAAQWKYQLNESAFTAEGVNIAMTANAGYAFGFRCQGQDMEVLFLTNSNSFTNESLGASSLAPPQLLVRVDDHAVIEMNISLVENGGKSGAIGYVEMELANAVRNAKKRIAVALRILGEIQHEEWFDVVDSTIAIDKITAACGITE